MAKKELQELLKREGLGNKACTDCGNPNPQWASVRCVVYSFCRRLAYEQLVVNEKLRNIHLLAMCRIAQRIWSPHQVRNERSSVFDVAHWLPLSP